MTARIIDMDAWRAAHPQQVLRVYSAMLGAWLWPLRVWLAWWGIR